MLKRVIFLMLVSSAFWSGARKETANPSGDCKKYLDGVFGFSKDANFFIARTDTVVLEVVSDPPGGSFMVRYKIRWSENGCDHDLVFDRTTPPGKTTQKKGDFVHLQIKTYDMKKVTYQMTYKNKPPQEMVMYRIE